MCVCVCGEHGMECKNYLWCLVFSMLFGPSDRPPPPGGGGVDCNGGGGGQMWSLLQWYMPWCRMSEVLVQILGSPILVTRPTVVNLMILGAAACRGCTCLDRGRSTSSFPAPLYTLLCRRLRVKDPRSEVMGHRQVTKGWGGEGWNAVPRPPPPPPSKVADHLTAALRNGAAGNPDHGCKEEMPMALGCGYQRRNTWSRTNWRIPIRSNAYLALTPATAGVSRCHKKFYCLRQCTSKRG